MSPRRRQLFDETLAAARAAARRGSHAEAFALLERAHIIGQLWIGPHLLSHWEMLRVGLHRGDVREVFGQILRLALVVPGTWLGRLPEGNTGGSNVNPFRPMSLPTDLRDALDETK